MGVIIAFWNEEKSGKRLALLCDIHIIITKNPMIRNGDKNKSRAIKSRGSYPIEFTLWE